MNSISISGWEGNDDVTGSAGVDTIYGSDGNDVLHGGVGVDSTIYPGTDRLFGENGDDTIYTDIDGAFAWGGNGNDVLLGGDGADEINGENGNDILSGGKGDDRLNGGDGADIIRYADRGFGTDTIASFGAEDKMDLSALGIGSFEQLARYIEPYGDAYSGPTRLESVGREFHLQHIHHAGS